MKNSQARQDLIDTEITAIRAAMPVWIDETIELVELAVNQESAENRLNPDTAQRSRKLIVEVAEWQKARELAVALYQPAPAGRAAHPQSDNRRSMDEANAAAARELMLR